MTPLMVQLQVLLLLIILVAHSRRSMVGATAWTMTYSREWRRSAASALLQVSPTFLHLQPKAE
jgi:hypothetical protein